MPMLATAFLFPEGQKRAGLSPEMVKKAATPLKTPDGTGATNSVPVIEIPDAPLKKTGWVEAVKSGSAKLADVVDYESTPQGRLFGRAYPNVTNATIRVAAPDTMSNTREAQYLPRENVVEVNPKKDWTDPTWMADKLSHEVNVHAVVSNGGEPSLKGVDRMFSTDNYWRNFEEILGRTASDRVGMTWGQLQQAPLQQAFDAKRDELEPLAKALDVKKQGVKALSQDAKGGKYKGRFSMSKNFLATDKVPETIFGIPVVSKREQYQEKDIKFFEEHPDAGGYYDLGEEGEE